MMAVEDDVGSLDHALDLRAHIMNHGGNEIRNILLQSNIMEEC